MFIFKRWRGHSTCLNFQNEGHVKFLFKLVVSLFNLTSDPGKFWGAQALNFENSRCATNRTPQDILECCRHALNHTPHKRAKMQFKFITCVLMRNCIWLVCIYFQLTRKLLWTQITILPFVDTKLSFFNDFFLMFLKLSRNDSRIFLQAQEHSKSTYKFLKTISKNKLDFLFNFTYAINRTPHDFKRVMPRICTPQNSKPSHAQY